MDTVKKRSELDPVLTWDLTAIYENDEAWENEFVSLDGLLKTFLEAKGHLHESSAVLLPLALLLFLTGIILRPMLDHESRSYWQQETLFRGSRCPTLETKERDYLAGQLKTFMQKGKP